MSRPTYAQAVVLRRAGLGLSLHHGFQGPKKSKAAINRAFDERTAAVRACRDAGWIGAAGDLTLQGEAALARYDKGGAHG